MNYCEICSSLSYPLREKQEFTLYKCSVCGFCQFDYSQFDKIAQLAPTRKWLKPSKSHFLRVQLFKTLLFEGKHILELGSGAATFQQALDRSNISYASYTNIDTLTTSQQAKSLGYNVMVADITKPINVSKTIDTVISSHSLEHIPYPKSVLQKVWAPLVKPNKIIYVEVPVYDEIDLLTQDEHLVFEHVSYFNTSSLLNLMEETFDVIESGKHTYNVMYCIGRGK